MTNRPATDPASSLLFRTLQASPANSLWLIDENISQPLPAALPHIQAITNRFDLFQHLQQSGWHSRFSDFDFSHLPRHSLSRILLRIPKEKPLVHYLINQAAELLEDQGELVLIGDKSEGIRSYSKRAREKLGGQFSETKINAGLWFASITYDAQFSAPDLDDQNYTQLRELSDKSGFSFISKPGLYGWQKVDQGSAFLADELAMLLNQSLPISGRLLDLGCGFGYLSLRSSSADTQLTCTDNNAAALRACQANIDKQGLSAEILASDAGDTLQGPYDTILCNPPFHSGFATNSDLTSRFLAAAARLLSHDGNACFVVNKHIALEHKASSHFGKIQLHADNGHFKLIHLSQPRH
ncbi:methyltransferase [Nitrincola sp.]|uniref:methyltransferase n=1 Tax=Nitrincola sp. TaxID=1926584 RepID=UPI003A955D94